MKSLHVINSDMAFYIHIRYQTDLGIIPSERQTPRTEEYPCLMKPLDLT